jgi:peptidoglycan hydrolase CwlO-like protein
VNKQNLIIGIIVLAVGFIAGAFFINGRHEDVLKEAEIEVAKLTKDQENHQVYIDSLYTIIKETEVYRQYTDSVILSVKSELFRTEQQLIEEKKKVDNYTNEELTNYLYNRYHQ